MSRVSHHWLRAFQLAGLETVSFDPTTAAIRGHNSFLDLKLRAAAKPHLRSNDILLVHEPLSGAFAQTGLPLVVFSHGIEARLKQVTDQFSLERRRLKSYLTFPLWERQRQATNRGLSVADLVLVLNSTDENYLQERGVCRGQIVQYRNGVNQLDPDYEVSRPTDSRYPRLLFLGTWLERKGIRLLRDAYQYFRSMNVPIFWRLAGTQVSEENVRAYLQAEGDPNVEVIPSFCGNAEASVFSDCEIFVLPSFAEGQPLALLEAMNRGMCCVATSADGQLDLLRNDDSGLLFSIGNSSEFITALEQVLHHAPLRRRLGASARREVAGRSWENVSDEVVHMVVSTFNE